MAQHFSIGNCKDGGKRMDGAEARRESCLDLRVVFKRFELGATWR
jgi:hypothetical protein